MIQQGQAATHQGLHLVTEAGLLVGGDPSQGLVHVGVQVAQGASLVAAADLRQGGVGDLLFTLGDGLAVLAQVRKVLTLVREDLAQGAVAADDLQALPGAAKVLLDPLGFGLGGLGLRLDPVQAGGQQGDVLAQGTVVPGHLLDDGGLVLRGGLRLFGLFPGRLGVGAATVVGRRLQGLLTCLHRPEVEGRLVPLCRQQVASDGQAGQFLVQHPILGGQGGAGALQGPTPGLRQGRGLARRRRGRQIGVDLLQLAADLGAAGPHLGEPLRQGGQGLFDGGEPRLLQGRFVPAAWPAVGRWPRP